MSHFFGEPVLATAIIVVKTAILVFGSLITYFSFKAYRRTGAPSLRALALGFGIITFGAILAGAFDLLLDVELAVGVLVDSMLTMIGFAVITYSLYVE